MSRILFSSRVKLEQMWEKVILHYSTVMDGEVNKARVVSDFGRDCRGKGSKTETLKKMLL